MRVRGMRGSSLNGWGRPMFRPGPPLLRPRGGRWPGLWGFGCLIWPVLGVIGSFLLAVLWLMNW